MFFKEVAPFSIFTGSEGRFSFFHIFAILIVLSIFFFFFFFFFLFFWLPRGMHSSQASNQIPARASTYAIAASGSLTSCRPGWNLRPSAAQTLLILLHHSGNSCIFFISAFLLGRKGCLTLVLIYISLKTDCWTSFIIDQPFS